MIKTPTISKNETSIKEIDRKFTEVVDHIDKRVVSLNTNIQTQFESNQDALDDYAYQCRTRNSTTQKQLDKLEADLSKDY